MNLFMARKFTPRISDLDDFSVCAKIYSQRWITETFASNLSHQLDDVLSAAVFDRFGDVPLNALKHIITIRKFPMAIELLDQGKLFFRVKWNCDVEAHHNSCSVNYSQSLTFSKTKFCI